MKTTEEFITDLMPEIQFFTSRSSGPGGQNVNKVNTKVELRFHIRNSTMLNITQKELLLQRLASKLTNDGFLIVVSQRSNSQLANKEDVLEKFYRLLNKALTPAKPRRKTQPSKSSVEKRLTYKKLKSEIKQNRQKVDEG